jgi:hypothetical protein
MPRADFPFPRLRAHVRGGQAERTRLRIPPSPRPRGEKQVHGGRPRIASTARFLRKSNCSLRSRMKNLRKLQDSWEWISSPPGDRCRLWTLLNPVVPPQSRCGPCHRERRFESTTGLYNSQPELRFCQWSKAQPLRPRSLLRRRLPQQLCRRQQLPPLRPVPIH